MKTLIVKIIGVENPRHIESSIKEVLSRQVIRAMGMKCRDSIKKYKTPIPEGADEKKYFITTKYKRAIRIFAFLQYIIDDDQMVFEPIDWETLHITSREPDLKGVVSRALEHIPSTLFAVGFKE